MGKAFALSSDGLIGGLSNARCSIVRPTCHADQNVLFRPAALRIHFPQLLEIDLELASAIGECGSKSDARRVGKGCVSTCRSRWSPYHAKKILTLIVIPH